MSRRKKIIFGILILLLVALVVIVVILPRVLDLDRYRPQIVELIEKQSGRPAAMGHLALTVFPRLSIRADDFTLKNPAGFPQGDFLKAQRIYAIVDVWSLWNYQVVIKSLDLERPEINLLCDLRGNWNSGNQTSPTSSAPDPPGDKPLFTLGPISNVKISKGRLSVANELPSGQAGPAFVEANGVSGRLRQFDPNALAESGQGESQRSSLVAEGTFEVAVLHVTNVVVNDVKSKIHLFPKQVFFDGLEFKGYGGGARGDLSFSFVSPNTRYHTQARLSGVNVTKLLDAFPDARGKMTGILDGDLDLDGEVGQFPDPLAAMAGSGHLTARKGRFPTLHLDTNLLQLFRVAKMGPASGDPSAFSSIAMDFTIANDRIHTTKAKIVGNGVEIEAAGSLGLAGNGSLDYQGVARLATSKNTLTSVLEGLTGATLKRGKMVFPFKLTGTFKNPQFTLRPNGTGNKQ